MATYRTLKISTLEDDRPASLSDSAWRLWVSMLLMVDDHGNCRASAGYLAGRVWWRHSESPNVSELLIELVDKGSIQLYDVKGQRYAHLNNFAKHQSLKYIGKSAVPGPEKDLDMRELPGSSPSESEKRREELDLSREEQSLTRSEPGDFPHGEDDGFPLTSDSPRGRSAELAESDADSESTTDSRPLADSEGSTAGDAGLDQATATEVAQLALQHPTKPHGGFDFEAIYRAYPRKVGKKKGLEKLRRTVKTAVQFEHLGIAVANYAAAMESKGTAPEFVKQFDTFSGCWEDWVVVEKDAAGSGVKGLNRRNILGKNNLDMDSF